MKSLNSFINESVLFDRLKKYYKCEEIDDLLVIKDLYNEISKDYCKKVFEAIKKIVEDKKTIKSDLFLHGEEFCNKLKEEKLNFDVSFVKELGNNGKTLKLISSDSESNSQYGLSIQINPKRKIIVLTDANKEWAKCWNDIY